MADSPFTTMIAIAKGREKNPESIRGSEILVSKALGFIDTDIGSRVSKYRFAINPDIFRGLMFIEFANLGKMPSWIKKQKEEKPDLLGTLIVDYWNKFGLDKRELKENMSIIRKIVETDLKEFLHELGVDEKTFKKLGVELSMPTVQSLEKWL